MVLCLQALLENAKRASETDKQGNANEDLAESEDGESSHSWLHWVGDWFSAPACSRFDKAAAAGVLLCCSGLVLCCAVLQCAVL